MKTQGVGQGCAVSLEILREADLGRGEFDGGRITEIKPIPFPQEREGSRRLGPLFYWAWATARGDGVIGMHPHRGFEIMSYVIEGEIGHSDTGGNRRRVGAGGVQVMRTGSGISHQEEMYGERTDFFQIWFEPDLKRALEKPARYADFEDAAFPVADIPGGGRIKRIIGNGGPVEIDTPALAEDVALAAGARHGFALPAGHVLAAVAFEGTGTVAAGEFAPRAFSARDFAIVKADAEAQVAIEAGEAGARLFAVQVPLSPGYPFYSER